VLPVVRHGLTIEKPTEDLDRLGEPGLANRGWIEALANGFVLGEGMPCSDPYFEATSAQMVQAGQLLGQMDRMVKVIVQNERADAESRRAIGDSHQGRQGRPSIDDVIPRVHYVKASFLSRSGLRAQLVCRALSYLEAKAKRPHD